MIAGRTFGRLALLAAALLIFSGGVISRSAAAPFTLSGGVTSGTMSFTIDDLKAFSEVTATANDGNSYVGASLWAVLGNGARIDQTPTPANGSTNNPILSRYIMATGADGRMSLLSAGEIHAMFGAPVDPGAPDDPYRYVLAYSQNGTELTTPKLVVLEDPTGTRNVMDLVNLDVRNVPRPPFVQMAPPSTEFTLTGTDSTATYNQETLKALPSTTVLQGHFTNSSAQQDYTGVNLWDLLKSVGIGASDEDILTSYVVATGTDGFEVVYSLAELNPAFHGTGDKPDLLAYATVTSTNPPGVPVDFGAAGPGFARIVKPGDAKGGRYVSNLTNLEIVDTVPLPATLILLLVGLVGMLPAVCRWLPGTRAVPGAV